MLPLEKCLELQAAGYPLDHFFNEPKSPSGDELLAECVKLLPEGAWLRPYIYPTSAWIEVWFYPLTAMAKMACVFNTAHLSRDQTLAEALADAWLWLNERKKRND